MVGAGIIYPTMEDSLNVKGHHSFSFKGEAFEGFRDEGNDFSSEDYHLQDDSMFGRFSASSKGKAFEDFQDGMPDFQSSNYLDGRQSPSADQVYVPYYDIDTKWRSISVAHPAPAFFRAHNGNDILKRGHTDAVKGLAKKNFNANVTNTIEVIPSTIRSQPHAAPESKAPSQPFLLMNTHFETTLCIETIKATIVEALNIFPEVSFAVEDEFTVSVDHALVILAHIIACTARQ